MPVSTLRSVDVGAAGGAGATGGGAAGGKSEPRAVGAAVVEGGALGAGVPGLPAGGASGATVGDAGAVVVGAAGGGAAGSAGRGACCASATKGTKTAAATTKPCCRNGDRSIEGAFLPWKNGGLGARRRAKLAPAHGGVNVVGKLRRPGPSWPLPRAPEWARS